MRESVAHQLDQSKLIDISPIARGMRRSATKPDLAAARLVWHNDYRYS